MTDTAASTDNTSPAPDNDEGGLLASATPTAPTAPDADSAKTEIAHRDPDEPPKPELRERPAYIPEKFWDKNKGEPNLEAMAKSYAELEKNFRSGKHKAPEGGKYALDAVAGKIAEDDPLLGKYAAWAGKYGLPQAAFDELLGEVTAMAGETVEQAQISARAEREALGPNAEAIVTGMVDWARKLVSTGVWSVDDFEEFKVMGGTAAGMKTLMKLRESYEGRVPLPQTAQSSDTGISDAELHAMVGDPRYLKDAGFRAKVERLFAQRYGGKEAA